MHLHLPNDIKVLAPSEKQIAYTKENFGLAIAEVLAKEATHGMYQILGAIETLVGQAASAVSDYCGGAISFRGHLARPRGSEWWV